MDLNQLKTFVTVAQEKHLTRAAERLFTSQPAVSAQLKSLEEKLGLRLFDRTPKGMLITPAGEHLLGKARNILEQADNLLAEAKEIEGSVLGNLEVGINSDFAFLKIPELLHLARERHPGMQLNFIHSMSTYIVPDIRKGVIDTGFFFGTASPVDLNIIKLADIETAVVIPTQLASELANADIPTLAQAQWIYTTKQCPFYPLKEEIFKDSDLKPTQDLFVDTEDGIRELIKSNAGISLLRRDDADKAEKEGWGQAWKGTTPSIPLYLAVHANRINDPLIKAWLTIVQSCWPSDNDKTALEQTA